MDKLRESFMRISENVKTKRYNLSSGMGFLYIFLIILAVNLTGFNFLLTNSETKEKEQADYGFNILKTVKLDQNELNQHSFVINPELQIFQQIIRHSKLDPKIAMDVASVINTESGKYGIDPFLVLSVIQVESRFKPRALSHKGARGIMQIMPRTGKYVAKKYEVPFKSYQSLYDPVTNIKLGIAYLSYLENLYGNNMEYALFAYNHGPKKSKHIKRKFKKSKPYYVKKVMSFKQLLDTERYVREG
ncbi:MAG: lytic transglycosylase domain-containing protein [Thermodesulfobacteriota bacterium]